jgi:DNA-binding NtrC family response regulator
MLHDYRTMYRDVKKIVIADQNLYRRDYLSGVLQSEEYRILAVDNLLSLIETLSNFQVDLLIAHVDLPGILIDELLSYIRKRDLEMKVILIMNYSPEIERNLRPFKILFMMTWPIRIELLRSIVARGLEVPGQKLACLGLEVG